MPKPLELRKVIHILLKYGVIYVSGKGRQLWQHRIDGEYSVIPVTFALFAPSWFKKKRNSESP